MDFSGGGCNDFLSMKQYEITSLEMENEIFHLSHKDCLLKYCLKFHPHLSTLVTQSHEADFSKSSFPGENNVFFHYLLGVSGAGGG